MSKSNRLRVSDVRQVHRLCHDCYVAGTHPDDWAPVLFSGMVKLVGARVATGGEGIWARGMKGPKPEVGFDTGWSKNEREMFAQFMLEMGPAGNLMVTRLQKRKRNNDHPSTRTRKQLVVDDNEWLASPCFDRWFRQGNIDHSMISVLDRTEDQVHVITLHRTLGERDFSERERRIIRELHTSLAYLLDKRYLSSVFDRDPFHILPNMQREVLMHLRAGLQPKAIAEKLDLSVYTINSHCKEIYRHLDVHTRTELLIKCWELEGKKQ